MNIKEYIKQWAESYKTDLTENIMPFWMEHGWDKVNGGSIPVWIETEV